jgi:hypothetical protein
MPVYGGTLTPADRPRWAAARTLADLGELTAQWLEGRIDSRPGYYGRVDEDKAPGLTETLILLNRAGFLTDDSQAGFDGKGFDNAHWQQRAAVTGFASEETYGWLEASVHGTRFKAFGWPTVSRQGSRPMPAVCVTRRNSEECTWYGDQYSMSELTDEFAGCGHDAIDALCSVLTVTVYDVVPGPNELWAVLRQAAHVRAQP